MQSGRRENLLTKWIYFLLKKGPPKPSTPARPEQAAGGSDILLFPRPCQAIAGRRTDYLLSPLRWSFRYRQRRLFSFFTALSFLRVEAGTLQWEPVSAPARRCPGCLLMAGGREFFCMERRNCPPTVDNCASVWYHNGRKTNMAREVFRKTASIACRRSKTLRRPHPGRD